MYLTFTIAVPKSTFKPVAASAKVRRSSSPLPSTPEQSGTPASPFTGNVAKVNTEEVTLAQSKSKENTTNTEKEFQNKAASAVSVRETPGHKGNFGTKPMDLESMLISLLSGNPKGMSLKVCDGNS